MALLGVSGLVGGLEWAGPWLAPVEGTFTGPGLVGLRRGPLFSCPDGLVGLRLLKVNFPWLGLVGLGLGVTLPNPRSLGVVRDGETMVESVILLRPGLVIGVVLVGLSLSGVVGDTRPCMVLETRAETVTRLRSGEAERLGGLGELSEVPAEMVVVGCGLDPFSTTPGDVFMELEGVSALLTPGEVATEGEEDLEVSAADDLFPGWTGGRGARYLTLAGCD